jgi:hypothetical protein
VVQGIAATSSGTAEYAAKHRKLVYRSFGNSGLLVSEAGFGCYRIDVSVAEHRQALEYALRSGINLIDTSANYADGGSERLVGSVMTEMIERGVLDRDQVVVVTKAGYLQGENLELSRQRKMQRQAFPDLVEYDEGLEHCIHPAFLEDQLTRSLQRLQLERIDCYLLHNPEYYLRWAAHKLLDQAAAKNEFLRRIRLAFAYLESEVRAGRIGCYGISSNTFNKEETDYDYTSLAAIWQIACEISDQHHFRVIEMPMNLLEPEALTRINQPDGISVLSLAAEKRLGVLINRPLNAIVNDRLVRLAENVYKKSAAREATAFGARVSQIDPDWQVSSLSRLALRALRSTVGISSVLVGMRQVNYVAEVLSEIAVPCEKKARLESWQKIAGAWKAGH